MLKSSDIIVYSVGFLEHQDSQSKTEQKLHLQQLADVTGGEAFFPTTTKQLDQVFSRIVSQVRAQYSLGFISSDAKKDGTWRKLDVRLLGDKAQSLTIRTRKGYYAPHADTVSSVPCSRQAFALTTAGHAADLRARRAGRRRFLANSKIGPTDRLVVKLAAVVVAVGADLQIGRRRPTFSSVAAGLTFSSVAAGPPFSSIAVGPPFRSVAAGHWPIFDRSQE